MWAIGWEEGSINSYFYYWPCESLILKHFKAYLPNKQTAQFLSLDQACLSYEMVDFHRAAMLQVSL